MTEIVVRQYRPVITLSGTGEFTCVEQFILPGSSARHGWNVDTWAAIVRWRREQAGPDSNR